MFKNLLNTIKKFELKTSQIFVLLCLFFAQTIDFGKWFGLSSVNGFLAYGLSLQDILVILISCAILTCQKWFDLFPKNFTLVQILCFIAIFIFSAISIWLHTPNFLNVLALFKVWARLVLWLYLFKFHEKFSSWYILPIIVLFGFFDHMLISSSLPALFVWILVQIKTTKNTISNKFNLTLLNLVNFWISINIFTGFYQFLTGKNLGLKILGEQILSTQRLNIATVNFGSWETLRIYGLAMHPNILGLVLVIYLIFSLHYFRSYKYKKSLVILTTFAILLTFSRVAIFATVLTISTYFLYTNRLINFEKIKKALIQPIILAFIVIFTILLLVQVSQSRQASDNYRQDDLSIYSNYYTNLSLTKKIFGIGLGQYPINLYKNYPKFETWQWQPVHNTFLNILIEIGIIPTLLMVYIFRQNSKDKKLKI